MNNIIDAKIKEKRLVNEYNISKFTENSELSKNMKLQTFDSSYFCGKICFDDDGTQNYLVFQSI